MEETPTEEMKSEELAEFDQNLKAEMLDKLGMSLARTRSEAIDGREQSGIERIWVEDEEYYEGIDDANRDGTRAWDSKPAGQVAITDGTDGGDGSTIFFNITAPYVDAASAKIADMLIPTDDKNFAIGPTPLPDLAGISKGKIPLAVQGQIARDPRVTTDEQRATVEAELVEAELVDSKRLWN